MRSNNAIKGKDLKTLYCRVHGNGQQRVLAAADKELIGKTFKEGEIEFYASGQFFKGFPASEKELTKLLKEYKNVNLFGKKTVSTAKKLKIISDKNIKKIKGIPMVQIYWV